MSERCRRLPPLPPLLRLLLLLVVAETTCSMYGGCPPDPHALSSRPPTAHRARRNLAVGGPTTSFTGQEPLGDTLNSGPKAMLVDYVRVHGLRYALSDATAGQGGGGRRKQQTAGAKAAR